MHRNFGVAELGGRQRSYFIFKHKLHRKSSEPGAGSSVISCAPYQRKTVASQWRKCRHLIIDEISMVDGNFFKKLEAVARQAELFCVA
jgi:hypothetical protein